MSSFSYFVIYSVILFFLIKQVKKWYKGEKKFSKILIYELIAIIFTQIISNYYKSLPTGTFMPGLDYFSYKFYSFIFALIYILLTFITILIGLIKKR